MADRCDTINIADVVVDSIVDGPGIRVAIFAQGCVHNCPGCHNPQSHQFGTGKDMSVQELYDTVRKNPLCRGVTFSGGDPFCQPKQFGGLAKLLRQNGYEVAAYTGYTYNELVQSGTEEQMDMLKSIDILIDGRFLLEQKSLDLRFVGSANQRIIDVQQSLAKGEATLCTQTRWTGA